MKKCVLMFALFLITLILATMTEGKKETVPDKGLMVENNIKNEMLLEHKSVEPIFKK